MLKELISSVLLIALTCIVICFSSRIPINRRKNFLSVQATLEGGEEVDFKLSSLLNRPFIRDSNNELFKWEGKSYNTAKMKPYLLSKCPPVFQGDREFVNSISFPGKELNLADVHLTASQRPFVSKWLEYNGVLGLFPMRMCEEGEKDPNAFINQLRGENSGYTIDASSLSITNEFPTHAANSSFDGLSFNISQIAIDQFIFTDSIVGILDLESNAIKVPLKIFEQLLDSFAITGIEYFDQTEGSKFISNIDIALKQFKIKLSEGAEIEFPVQKFWSSHLEIPLGPFFEFHEISTAFVPHDEDYWSFGLKVLDVCKISVDLERGRIYFEPTQTRK